MLAVAGSDRQVDFEVMLDRLLAGTVATYCKYLSCFFSELKGMWEGPYRLIVVVAVHDGDEEFMTTLDYITISSI